MIVIDSEFQSLIPPLSDDEYKGLEQSILAEGVREPIITWNGTIIDGHNRYRICEEHGIKCPQVERKFESRNAAKIWIIENQFGRRNLSRYDRSVLALQLEPLYAAEARRRQSEHGYTAPGKPKSLCQNSDEVTTPARTDDQLAKLAGTSRDTIRKVKVIETEAENGNETAIEARDAVRDGKMSIHAAYTEVRPKGNSSDTRPICVICGKPIDDGDSYGHNPFKHKSCAVIDTEVHRGKRGGRLPTGQYAEASELVDADHDLRNNEATFTIGSLMAELTANVRSMSEAMAESISINEDMGVRLTDAQKARLDEAVANLHAAIKEIGEEHING